MQFRELLERIAAKREAGKPVEPFDLLDFDAYDELLKTFAIDLRAKPPRIRKRHQKRIRRTQFIKTEQRKADQPKQRLQIAQAQQKDICGENVGKIKIKKSLNLL